MPKDVTAELESEELVPPAEPKAAHAPLDAEVLRQGYLFLRRVENRLRW